MIKSDLQKLWRAKELERGHIITVSEVKRETKLSWDTVRKLKEGQTGRFDGEVIAALCKFFDVPSGSPVPFLVYSPEE